MPRFVEVPHLNTSLEAVIESISNQTSDIRNHASILAPCVVRSIDAAPHVELVAIGGTHLSGLACFGTLKCEVVDLVGLSGSVDNGAVVGRRGFRALRQWAFAGLGGRGRLRWPIGTVSQHLFSNMLTRK